MVSSGKSWICHWLHKKDSSTSPETVFFCKARRLHDHWRRFLVGYEIYLALCIFIQKSVFNGKYPRSWKLHSWQVDLKNSTFPVLWVQRYHQWHWGWFQLMFSTLWFFPPLHTGNKAPKLGDPSLLWNPGHTSPEVQNRDISGPTKIFKKYSKKNGKQ